MTFWDLLALIGLVLGLGAALDYLVKSDPKLAVSNYLLRLGNRTPTVTYRISPILDKIFGPKLASWRAILISSLLSLLSLILTYAFAYATTANEIVSIFSDSPSPRAVGIFFIFVIGCIAGDYFSFAQTRIFLRAVDGMRHGVVSVGLALADGVISLAIFVGFFSVTRLAAYLIIMGTTTGTIQQEKNLNVSALKYTVAQIEKDGIASKSELEWSSYLANIKSSQDASILDEITRRYTNDLIIGQSKDIVSVIVHLNCDNNPLSIIQNLDDVRRVISNEIASHRGIQIDGTEYNHISTDVARRMDAWTPTNPKCLAPTLSIRQNLTPAGLLLISGLWNAGYASFERTAFDVYTNVGFKFSPYTSVNPESDIGTFYSSLIMETQYGFLGSTPDNPGIHYALSEFTYQPSKESENLQIPLSPMLASCLTISVFFAFYILTIYISKLAGFCQSLVRSIQNKINIDVAPFTFVAISLALLILVYWSVSGLISAVWRLVFGSFA